MLEGIVYSMFCAIIANWYVESGPITRRLTAIIVFAAIPTSSHQVIATGPEQVWVADITYIPTREGSVYLSLVTDAYSRKIVGFHVHDSLHAKSVTQAFRKALKERRTNQRLVHHSDRGAQYCSDLYQKLHAKHGVTCSMTDGYDCYQNALAERVNGILKTELLLYRPENLEQAEQMVREAITIYNQERPHLSLNRVGGGLAIAVLSHHRTYGSVYGGSDCAIKSVYRIQYRDQSESIPEFLW